MGAIFLGIALVIAVGPALLHRDCAQVLAQNEKIKADFKAQMDATPGNDFEKALAALDGKSRTGLARAMASDVAAVEATERAEAERIESESPAFLRRVQECGSYQWGVGPVLGGVSAVIAALLWAAAFVLAGSFWHPPKRARLP